MHPTDPEVPVFDHADLLLALSRALADTTREERWPALCRAVVTSLRVDDGSIALALSGVPELMCSTSERAAGFGQAQEVAGEGPVYDALASAAPILLDGVASGRWPRLEAFYDTVDIGAVVAVPMRAQPTEVVGVLTVHHSVHSGLGRELHGSSESRRADAMSDVTFVADTIGAVVLADALMPVDEQMRWIDRDRISQAVGMVVAQSGGRPEDALALIKARAFVEGATIGDVCRRVLARELDLGRGGGAGEGSGPR